jgi:hypothetical protein
VNEDIQSLIDGVTKAWDQVVKQVDEMIRGMPEPAPGPRSSPAAMSDGQLAGALHAAASSLINGINPARQATHPVPEDPRWRFNLPAAVETHMQAMFTEASDAFGLAVTGLGGRASAADLAAVGSLAEILVRARWLVEPADAMLRRERSYALTADAIAWLRETSGHAEDVGEVEVGQPDLAGDIADRTETMAARLDEIRQDDGLQPVKLPKRRKLLDAYLPGSGLALFALLTAAGARPGAAPSGLFYAEAGSGNATYSFQRLHITRAYWLAQAITLYAHLCDTAVPVLGREDWKEVIATAEIRVRPLSQEAERRYQRRLQRGLHPGL